MKKLLYLAYFSGIFLVACYSYRTPEYNFDMLPYIALVVKMENKDIPTIHRATYQSVRENVPPEIYQRLTDSVNPYRKKMKENAAYFFGQLPFYMIKPFYTALIYLFYKAGSSLPHATVLPSIIAYLLTSLLLLYWLEKYLSLAPAVILGLLILFSSPFLAVARMSTPDGLSALLLFSAVYFILEKPAPLPLFLLLAASLFARLDNVIACFGLLTLSLFAEGNRKISLRLYFSITIALALCYFLITLSTRSFGWSPFFYNSFRAAGSHFPNWLSYVKEGLYYSHLVPLFLLFVLLLIPFSRDSWIARRHGAAASQAAGPDNGFDRSLTLVLLAILIARFLLYPDPADRYYIAYYEIALILLVRKLCLSEVFLKPAHSQNRKP